MQTTDTTGAALALGSITYAGPAARWRTEVMRSHANARLIHITKGQGRITVAGLTKGYGPNNLIFLPAGTMYGIEVGPTVFGQMLTLPDTADWPDAPFHLRLRDVDPQKELVGLMEALERELQPQGDLRAAKCHLGLLAIFVERQLSHLDPSPADDRAKGAAARLVARYTTMVANNFQAHQSVSDYATKLGVTPTHLARSCRKTSGRSALSLLNDRIHFEACTLLKDTTTPVKDVARRLGFSSAAYFTRSFQEKAGVTPSDFRKTARR